MIKKILALLLIAGLIAITPVFAEDEEDFDRDVRSTSRGVYTTPSPALSNFLNTNPYIYHSHDIYLPERRSVCAGPGADIILYEGGNPLIERFTAEYRYDASNNEHQAYGVVTVNAYKAVTGLFK